jgi:hypothetical protein
MTLTNEQIITLKNIKEELNSFKYKDYLTLFTINEGFTDDNDYFLTVDYNNDLSTLIIHPDGSIAYSFIPPFDSIKKRNLEFLDNESNIHIKAVSYLLYFLQ